MLWHLLLLLEQFFIFVVLFFFSLFRFWRGLLFLFLFFYISRFPLSFFISLVSLFTRFSRALL
jgi:hypothetical protein